MAWAIACFALFGAGFGWLSYSRRHLFSEGATRPAEGADPHPLAGRLGWSLLCSGLWPLMALTGLHSWWRLSRARRGG
ncbi:MAG: hypothetical protein IV093_14775 [Rubrivivax sp.]|nr:hypothetical protein [Rubrivivax sp.]